ncbi:hypothetical protein CPB84DRAFT_1774504 [Gymnopilus junonius]|uniref:Uncharacterized protein n=1 Tax=Gymnopilus junonius TaxID=109634 RepID=A0A9P5NNJ8_GYMJU|nr:hypothetical protein CPB84DRAFT_1774504 [Gymnopilus junonius]
MAHWGSNQGEIDGSQEQVVNTGSNVYITIHDLSGSNLRSAEDVQNLLSRDRNVTMFLSPMGTGTSPIPPSLTGLPSSQSAGQGCTGFPSGYFRIRSMGTNHHWQLHWGERDSGNIVTLYERKQPTRVMCVLILYINLRGELCTSGAQIDVMNNVLVLTHSRPPSLPWPNPWSHPLPTFSYSEETKIITVKFYIDPVTSSRWPRPAEEWITARSPAVARVPEFKEISRWAPNMHSKFVHWTRRAGERWVAGSKWNLAVEKAEIEASGDTDRMKWELDSEQA